MPYQYFSNARNYIFIYQLFYFANVAVLTKHCINYYYKNEKSKDWLGLPRQHHEIVG